MPPALCPIHIQLSSCVILSRCLLEKAGKQRHKCGTDKGYTAACHKLLHSLRLGARVVVAVTFQQVDDTPDTKTSTQSDNESLKNGNCLFKKCHK